MFAAVNPLPKGRAMKRYVLSIVPAAMLLVVGMVACSCLVTCGCRGNSEGEKGTTAGLPPVPFELFPFLEEGSSRKWGYIDRQGKVVIQPRFSSAYNFSEGLALVNSGVIDEQARLVFSLPEGCHWIGAFYEGRAEFFLDEPGLSIDKTGFLDKQGKVVIQPRFDEVGKFREGRAWVRVGSKLDDGGMFNDLVGGKWGYIDRSGQWVVKPKFDYAAGFSDGLAKVMIEGGPQTDCTISHLPVSTFSR